MTSLVLNNWALIYVKPLIFNVFIVFEKKFQICSVLFLTLGNTVPHLRFQSEDGEEEESSHLHDAIPFQRDRSISLPEIKPLRQQYEQDVGRELRRISDEFDSSFHRVRNVHAVDSITTNFLLIH